MAAQKNGRKGQRQHGTDIWGRPKNAQGAVYGVQCKGKDRLFGAPVTAKELRDEVTKAREFSPPLSDWTLVTTAPKDAGIELAARQITAEHQQNGLFLVHVFGWEDLQSLISRCDNVIEKYYPDFTSTNRKVLEYFRDVIEPTSASAIRVQRLLTLDVDGIQRAFGGVSRALLSWPQETAGHWIDRPELEQLHSLLTQSEPTVSVLLGGPGEGKSALLARLGTRLVAEDVALLAIKADQLPRTISTLEALDAWIACSVPVGDALRRLAAERRVVLLIDQLDALAELMDQHSERLSVLLRLVGALADTPNLQILLSCRSFEFHNDVRLTSLKAEAITLSRLSWDQVVPLLRAVGRRTAGWSEEVREVLCTPQQLAVFLTHFSSRPNEVPAFSSYHGLLDRVIRERLEVPYGPRTVEVAEAIASEMAREEELWLARDRFERSFSKELRNLIAADIITLSEAGLSLSFRHQTLFDFLRARAFLRDNVSLAKHVMEEKQESLFVRPILWSALHHLREADRAAYRREFRTLWSYGGLRPHIRYLLVSFLGQVGAPDDEEAHWLLPTLDDPAVRRKTFRALSGSSAWFSRIESRLPSLMTAAPLSAWGAMTLLAGAVGFAADTVLALVDRYWAAEAEYSGHALQILSEIRDWDERSVALAARIADRGDVAPSYIRHLARRVAEKRADLVPELVVRSLEAAVRRIRSETPALPRIASDVALDETAIVQRIEDERATYGPFTALLEATTEWHDLEKLVVKAPRAFIMRAWPWLVDLLRSLAYDVNPLLNEYRSHRGLSFVNEIDAGDRYPLPRAFEVAMRGFAAADPEGFIDFLKANVTSDLMVVHRLLGIGLGRIVRSNPTDVLEYLLADPRRLIVGDFHDIHSTTRALLVGLVPVLTDSDARRVERAIVDWERYREIPADEDPKVRFERRRWAREHRLRLLRSFPSERLSPKARRLLAEEERALPDTRDYDHEPVKLVSVESPMSAAQMSVAPDDSIVELFEELPDATGWRHPTRPHEHVGGSIPLSREFANFAKTSPERALRILERFRPGAQERPAGAALAALGDGLVSPPVLLGSITALVARGFASDEFRGDVAHCLEALAHRANGLDASTCRLVESWVVDAAPRVSDQDPESPSDSEAQDGSDVSDHRSLLWNDGGLVMLPRGNYPYLRALMSGYRLREHDDVSGWLSVVERHLERSEDPKVWIALTPCLEFRGGDRLRVASFLENFVARKSYVLNTTAGVRLIARVHDRIPTATFDRIMDDWIAGPWVRGPQAAGEIGALALCLKPEDERARARIDALLVRSDCAPNVCAGIRLGIGHTLARAWSVPALRPLVTPLLTRLILLPDSPIAEAVHAIFTSTDPFLADDYTAELFEALHARPPLLCTRDATFVIERLKDLLRAGWNPTLVATVATVLVEHAGRELGNMQTSWAASADNLVEIALTLHRLPATRAVGLTLFEELLKVDAYGVDKRLEELDRRPFR